MKGLLAILGCALLVFGCRTSNDCSVDVSEINVSIERLEEELFKAESREDIEEFLKSNRTLTKEFLGSYQYPDESVIVNELWKRINNPSLDTVLLEIDKQFGDLKDLENEYAELFARIRNFYPEFTIPKIQTIVTGFGSSEMYITDSLIIIGLEYYTGKGSTYRPLGVPGYILDRYEKEYIVPTTALLLANDYIKEDVTDNTLIADMVYYGKKYYFAKQVLPCTDNELLIWYSDQELADVNENQHIIWAHFIENELLFTTSHLVKKKYLDERPKVLEIGNKCPGRIAAWLGWEIVQSYMDNHPEVSLQELMQMTDARRIFSESEYKPDVPGIL